MDRTFEEARLRYIMAAKVRERLGYQTIEHSIAYRDMLLAKIGMNGVDKETKTFINRDIINMNEAIEDLRREEIIHAAIRGAFYEEILDDFDPVRANALVLGLENTLEEVISAPRKLVVTDRYKEEKDIEFVRGMTNALLILHFSYGIYREEAVYIMTRQKIDQLLEAESENRSQNLKVNKIMKDFWLTCQQGTTLSSDVKVDKDNLEIFDQIHSDILARIFFLYLRGMLLYESSGVKTFK